MRSARGGRSDAWPVPPLHRRDDSQAVVVSDYERAREALTEQIRTSDGHATGGIVAQVVGATGLPEVEVLKAMIDLELEGRT